MKTYTRKQITEAIAYWKKQLNESEEEQEPTLAERANDGIAKLKEAIAVLEDPEAEDAGEAEALVQKFVEFVDANIAPDEEEEPVDGQEEEVVDEAESDLTKVEGTIGKVMKEHRDEILNLPSSQDAEEYMANLFKEAGINTPKSREILMNLKRMTATILNPKANYERTAVYLNDVIMKAEGNGMSRRSRYSRW